MANVWKTLQHPILALAPMADVTDAAFRRIIAACGKPDILWTEFVSADGLYHTRELKNIPDSENPLMKDLLFSKTERPIIAQLFTANPAMMEYGARLISELGFDGVDINMGCPHAPIEKQGAGAALIRKPGLARELIRAAKKGTNGQIPVTVKTRIGYNTNELTTWLPELLSEHPDAVIIHARTRKEMSAVPARWEHIRDAVKIRNGMPESQGTLILGNGDVQSVAEARKKALETEADGVMIGRGIFGNPWLFAKRSPELEERFTVLIEHCRLFEELCGHKSFAVMKKHFKAYVNTPDGGFPGSKELRINLMETETADEVEDCIKRFLKIRYNNSHVRHSTV